MPLKLAHTLQSLLAIAGLAASSPVASAGSIVVPVGTAEGLYLVTNESDHVYLGPATTTAANGPTPAIAVSKSLQARSNGVHCESNRLALNGPQTTMAVSQLATYFNDHKCFNGKSLYTVYGNTVAFACNYNSRGSCETESGILSDNDSISSICGTYSGGWYSHAGNSVGRTELGNGFC